MVRIEEGKIIIEMESNSPCEDIEALSNSLIDALLSMNPDMLHPRVINHILYLLQALLPNFDDLQKLHKI